MEEGKTVYNINIGRGLWVETRERSDAEDGQTLQEEQQMFKR